MLYKNSLLDQDKEKMPEESHHEHDHAHCSCRQDHTLVADVSTLNIEQKPGVATLYVAEMCCAV